MLKYLFVALFATFIFYGASPETAAACQKISASEKICGDTAPQKYFKGDKQLVAPVKVTVCHPYWNRLDIGRLNGRATRWWGPTIRYGNWHADLPATASECKSFWVKPGTVIDSFASCVNRIVRTPRMMRAGTYWLE